MIIIHYYILYYCNKQSIYLDPWRLHDGGKRFDDVVQGVDRAESIIDIAVEVLCI